MPSFSLQPLALKIFGGLHGSYDRVLALATLEQDRYWKRAMVEEASLHEGALLLDIGCGTGVLEEYVNRMGVSVVGVDLTEEMIRMAQTKRIDCLNLLSVADAQRLPFPDESFDAVVSCYVVKYCSPFSALASEATRVLREGGRLVIYDFTRPEGVDKVVQAFYVGGLLRLFGRLSGKAFPGLGFTLQALPKIIQDRRWDDSFGLTLEACGLEQIGRRRLSRGVVTMFWGTKT